MIPSPEGDCYVLKVATLRSKNEGVGSSGVLMNWVDNHIQMMPILQPCFMSLKVVPTPDARI